MQKGYWLRQHRKILCGSPGSLILFHQANRVCRVILGFLHVVRVCMEGFDHHSSAKRSLFSPTPFCNNVHKSGFFPPGESYSLNLNFIIISVLQKRKIYVREKS